MQPGPDDAGDKSPITKSETGPAGPDQVERETKPGAKPFSGGYYWLPNPTIGGITWSVGTSAAGEMQATTPSSGPG